MTNDRDAKEIHEARTQGRISWCEVETFVQDW